MLNSTFAPWPGVSQELCKIADPLPSTAYAEVRPGGRPGLILFVQPYGDLVNFDSHFHVLAADCVFGVDGVSAVLPPIPPRLLEHRFRTPVLDLLIRKGGVTREFAARISAWRHAGFSVRNGVRINARDAAGGQSSRNACFVRRSPSINGLRPESVDGRGRTYRIPSPLQSTSMR